MICDIRYWVFCVGSWASQLALVIKNMPANARTSNRPGFNPQAGKIPGGEHSNPHQYSCLENPMDREAWRGTVHRVAQSQT